MLALIDQVIGGFRQRVTSATPEQLHGWVDAIRDADTLEQVLQ